MRILDWLDDNFQIWATSVIIALIVTVTAWAIWREIKHPCIRSHRELRHHSDMYYIDTGNNVRVPVFNNYDSMDIICDERKP